MKYTLKQLREQLDVLIARSEAGEELVITRNDQPVVRISPVPAGYADGHRPPPGLMKGTIIYMSPDFDAPLDDFREYMG